MQPLSRIYMAVKPHLLNPRVVRFCIFFLYSFRLLLLFMHKVFPNSACSEVLNDAGRMMDYDDDDIDLGHAPLVGKYSPGLHKTLRKMQR